MSSLRLHVHAPLQNTLVEAPELSTGWLPSRPAKINLIPNISPLQYDPLDITPTPPYRPSNLPTSEETLQRAKLRRVLMKGTR